MRSVLLIAIVVLGGSLLHLARVHIPERHVLSAAPAQARSSGDPGCRGPWRRGRPRHASARVVDPDGRSAGHVLTAGPVPWTDDDCGWVLNLSVAPWSKGRGLGRALLDRALHGTRQAGLPTLDLSVGDGGPARRMYDTAGFRVLERVLSVRLPRSTGR